MTAANGKYLTVTERAILEILNDGMAHTRDELFVCLPNQDGTFDNLKIHIHNLRTKLPEGHTIICQLLNKRLHYRRVRIYNPDED